jgi:hypothetical protein
MSDNRKLIFTKSGFGVKEISKGIGIKRNLKTLIHILKQSRSMKMSENEFDNYDSMMLLESKIEELQQQIKERDELILELEKVREFYGDRDNWKFQSYSSDCKDVIFRDTDCKSIDGKGEFACSSGGKLARTPLKNQKLLDEIKGRV